MNTLFVVVLEDRHIDTTITVHGTRAGADAKVAEYKAGYGDQYSWYPERVTAPNWLGCERTDCDDGPSVRIERAELLP